MAENTRADNGEHWPTDLDPLERSLLKAISAHGTGSTPAPLDATPMMIAAWLEAQVTSRLLDHTARWLRREHDAGYYTIGSAGHESNAVVASALRTTDPALLHYRSGGFYAARAHQAAEQGVANVDAVRDVLRGMMAKATEPIAGGRHKVFGNHALSIIPQTSTIASHLPRAVGLALSFATAVDAPTTWPADSVVVCSFGDGSLNHSTAQGALNWAGHARRSGDRVPVLFVCEDNGLGLSVPTPMGWTSDSLTGRHGLAVAHADGADPSDVWRVASSLIKDVREFGRPGLLHLSTVRFLGHAGTDVETAYRTPAELAEDLVRDPIIRTAGLAADTGVSSPSETVDWYLDVRANIREVALGLLGERELTTAAEVMAPLAGDAPDGGSEHVGRPPLDVPSEEHLTLAQTINRVLADELEHTDDIIVFGEDVARKGGVYGVTRGLHKRFGADRVFDTLLDEQSILGLALGAALNGRVPIPEIQYLAYLHNAEDQLRGEAASLAFFSQRQYLNPMVVRVAAYGYQRGFGGHFHNDNSIAVLRDVPGLVIASPAHPSDAGPMLSACIAHARATGSVCVFLEPIARYHQTDLHAEGDRGWTAPYAPGVAPIGRARVHELADDASDDLTIITWANGLFLSLRAQRQLADEHGIRVRVVDMRWIAPLPVDDIIVASRATGRVLIVDETRRTGGVGEGVIATLTDAGFDGPIARVAARDSFVPLGDAADLVLVSQRDVVSAALELAQQNAENFRGPGLAPRASAEGMSQQ